MTLKSYWLCLILSSFACAQDKPLPTVEGTVVQAVTKEPVRKALVTLELARGEHDSALVATTTGTGGFRFADIKEGVYKLTVEKPGFLDGTYGKTKLDDEGKLLKIESGDSVPSLTLLLFPAGTISGRVLDADGDPQSGIEVYLWSRSRATTYSRRDRIRTNNAGEYAFSNLSPGTYYVNAVIDSSQYALQQRSVDSSGKVTKVTDLTTFYPAALSLADAQAVPVESGHDQSAIDIHIQRGTTLSLKGRIAGITSVPSSYRVSATSGEGWSQGEFLPNGEFIFRDLAPGKQHLTLSTKGPTDFQVIGETEVNLADQDVTGVVITPFKPAELHVRVVMEREEDKPLITGSVFLSPVRESDRERNGITEYATRNGKYVFDSVTPGKYWISFNNADGCYLKSVQSGGQMLDPQSLEIGDGAAMDLLMTYSRNVASVTGDVELPQDQSEHSPHVLLISEKPVTLPFSKSRRQELDQTFHFLDPHMPPGKYLAVATEEADPDLWNQSPFINLLRDKGVELDLREKDHTTVHLKLITKDETDQARKQLGL